MGDLDKAGSAAFKYTSTNPEREKELKERLEDIKGSYKAEKLPQQMFVRYFLKGLEYIKSKNVRVKDHMEKSVEEYIKSEEECRYRCEKPDPTFEYAPDIFSELARNLNVRSFSSIVHLRKLFHCTFRYRSLQKCFKMQAGVCG